jgi:hypothetical protein
MENIDIFYGHLEYFTGIRDILRPYDTFCVDLEIFFQFWYHVQRKIWQHWWGTERRQPSLSLSFKT